MAYQNNSMLVFFGIVCLLLVTTLNVQPIKVSMNNLEGIVQASICTGCSYGGTICKTNLQYIAGLSEAGNYDLTKDPITNNKYGIKSVTFQTIETTGYFEFPNTQQNGNRQTSGLLALPDTTGPIRGMVIYFHGTVLSKSEAPTGSSSFTQVYKALAGIFAANNYAVLFPDYPGLGSDSANVHPYVLYPQQNIRAAIYLLNSAVGILNQKYGGSTIISKDNPLPLLSNGYSEGGAYGVYFGACNTPSLKEKLIYCTKDLKLDEAYQIVAITGSEGAYDTSGVVKNFLLQEVGTGNGNPFKVVTNTVVNTGKPGLASLAILSYATYNPNPFTFKSALLQSFYNMQCNSKKKAAQSKCDIDGNHLNLEQALSLESSNSGGIVSAILNSAFAKQNNGYQYVKNTFYLLFSSENSLYSLIDKDVVLTDSFYSALSDSTIVDYGNDSPYPVFVFSLKKDSMVSPVNAYNFIENNKSGNVQSYFLDNSKWTSCQTGIPVQVDHIGAYVVSHLFILHYFEQVMAKRSTASTTTPSDEL